MTFYLVCYDIACNPGNLNESNRRRQKVAKLMEGYGLRVQKSVFECLLDDDQLGLLQYKLKRYLNPQEDQVRFYPQSVRLRRKVQILGFQPQRQIDDAVFVV